jgi:hypothetical protein
VRSLRRKRHKGNNDGKNPEGKTEQTAGPAPRKG